MKNKQTNNNYIFLCLSCSSNTHNNNKYLSKTADVNLLVFAIFIWNFVRRAKTTEWNPHTVRSAYIQTHIETERNEQANAIYIVCKESQRKTISTQTHEETSRRWHVKNLQRC